MTEVEFHTGVADPVDFACRLLRKAYRQGSKVLVTAPEAMLAQIDRALWVLDERDFVPHLRLAQLNHPDKHRTAALTPIWLARSVAEMLQSCDAPAHENQTRADLNGGPGVVVNVGAEAPVAEDMLALPLRWIEVVAIDADEAARGRERWRAYKALGLDVVHHKARAQDAP